MSDRYSRQSFLGPSSDRQLAEVIMGVVGLGGGGSQIVQQLGHLGVKHYVLFDHDVVEDSNLNRLIGATTADARRGVDKVEVATRLLHGLLDDASIAAHRCRWQDAAAALQRCDLVFGCVDSFTERDQLESACRRSLIPLIDIGLDVVAVDGAAPFLAGQVIVSMPGGPCMRCLNFLTEATVAAEGRRYGDAGPRPQIVFGNGVLASTAVAQAVALITGWTGPVALPSYLEYRGNDMTLQPSRLIAYAPPTCPHYPPSAVGTPRFRDL